MVPPSVKTPTPEPAEVETRKVRLCGCAGLCVRGRGRGRLKEAFVVERKECFRSLAAVSCGPERLPALGVPSSSDPLSPLPQVVLMQCNIESVEEGVKHHVRLGAGARRPGRRRGGRRSLVA